MSDEKTEEPTQKKIDDARKKGQVANSKDVTSAALLAAICACMMASWEKMLMRTKEMLLLPIEMINAPFPEAFDAVVSGVLGTMVSLTVPFLAVVVVVGIASNFLQVGPLLAFESILPDLNKLNPIEKLKQTFGIKNIVEFLKSSLKVIILGTITYTMIKGLIDPLLKLPYSGPDAILILIGPIMQHFCTVVVMVYIVMAGFDFFFQRKQHNKQLKMSKDEVKREYKEQEGDPHIKSQRRQLHEEMLTQNTVETVKKSSAVVANPTHVCVAIYYDKDRTPLPRVSAKGKDHLAKLMRKAADEANVPIIENVWLARSLYDEVPKNAYIPREFIPAVVEVLKQVQQIKRQRGEG